MAQNAQSRLLRVSLQIILSSVNFTAHFPQNWKKDITISVYNRWLGKSEQNLEYKTVIRDATKFTRLLSCLTQNVISKLLFSKDCNFKIWLEIHYVVYPYISQKHLLTWRGHHQTTTLEILEALAQILEGLAGLPKIWPKVALIPKWHCFKKKFALVPP